MALERKKESGLSGSFIPAGPLEELLIEAFRTPEARPIFLRRMLRSGILVLGKATDTGVLLRQWTLNGRKTIPFFTSRQRLEDFAGPDAFEGSIALSGRRLFALIPPEASAFLNARSPIGREFIAEEIAAILANFPEEPELDDDDASDDSGSESGSGSAPAEPNGPAQV